VKLKQILAYSDVLFLVADCEKRILKTAERYQEERRLTRNQKAKEKVMKNYAPHGFLIEA